MLSVTQQKIQLALLRAGKPLTVRKLMEVAGIQYNIRMHLEYLSSLKLITMNIEDTFPRRKFVMLTNRGLVIAKLLEQINSILNETHKEITIHAFKKS